MSGADSLLFNRNLRVLLFLLVEVEGEAVVSYREAAEGVELSINESVKADRWLVVSKGPLPVKMLQRRRQLGAAATAEGFCLFECNCALMLLGLLLGKGELSDGDDDDNDVAASDANTNELLLSNFAFLRRDITKDP